MSDELRYGMIKYNKKEKTFIIIDRIITMIFDSRVGFLDLEPLRLKDKLESDEINKLIAYMKPLMINATDRKLLKHIIMSSFLINFLPQKVLKFRMMSQQRKQLKLVV